MIAGLDPSNDGQHGVRIVTDAIPGSTGSVIYWRLSGEVEIAELTRKWAELGLDADLLPGRPSPAVALRRAMGAQKEKHLLVRGVKGAHFLVRERVGADDPEYAPELRVTLNAGGLPAFDKPEHTACPVIRAAFAAHLDQLDDTDVSGWLVKMARHLDAVPLRDSGGVYFVPAHRVDEMMKVREALARASYCRIHALPAARSEEVVAAVIDAVTTAVEAETKAIEEELSTPMKERALETRKERLAAEHARVSRYEALLGVKLASLRGAVELVEEQVCRAALTLAQEEEA